MTTGSEEAGGELRCGNCSRLLVQWAEGTLISRCPRCGATTVRAVIYQDTTDLSTLKPAWQDKTRDPG